MLTAAQKAAILKREIERKIRKDLLVEADLAIAMGQYLMAKYEVKTAYTLHPADGAGQS